MKNKGVTLIALIVTIVVLLILAGITIGTLTGENGILTQAGKAKDKTTEADAIERVQVEVLGSYGTDGTIEKEQLNKNLGNIDGLMLGETKFGGDNIIESLPVTVTLNGYDIEINSKSPKKYIESTCQILINSVKLKHKIIRGINMQKMMKARTLATLESYTLKNKKEIK